MMANSNSRVVLKRWWLGLGIECKIGKSSRLGSIILEVDIVLVFIIPFYTG